MAANLDLITYDADGHVDLLALIAAQQNDRLRVRFAMDQAEARLAEQGFIVVDDDVTDV